MPFDFSLVSAPFRMQPGLRRIAPGASQLTPNLPGSRHLREKMAVLASHPAQAIASTPAFDALPVLRTIAGEAMREAAPAFTVDESAADGIEIHAPLLGWSLRSGEPRGNGDPAIGALLDTLAPPLRPIALLCLAFGEDFAVIDGASTTIPWLAVCLPSRWAPEDKVGRRFAEVHAPVADNAVILAASDSLARLVTGDERWERFVWTISADPHLHQHPARSSAPWPSDADANALAALASFRSERQTFIPIGGARQAVFTIHVQSVPLEQALTTRDAATRVHDAVASMSPAVLAYRGLDGARGRLLDWLARRAAALPRATG
ncbi:MAG: heme-dependent oxidative N-demethylase subunit alpha family protein [Caldimonas sp.]